MPFNAPETPKDARSFEEWRDDMVAVLEEHAGLFLLHSEARPHLKRRSDALKVLAIVLRSQRD